MTQTGLTLGWNASTDNVGVTGYDVYRNGTKVATVTTTSSSQTGLACGTSYTFGVVARDAAGNPPRRRRCRPTTAACSTQQTAWTFCANEYRTVLVLGDEGRALRRGRNVHRPPYSLRRRHVHQRCLRRPGSWCRRSAVRLARHRRPRRRHRTAHRHDAALGCRRASRSRARQGRASRSRGAPRPTTSRWRATETTSTAAWAYARRSSRAHGLGSHLRHGVHVRGRRLRRGGQRSTARIGDRLHGRLRRHAGAHGAGEPRRDLAHRDEHRAHLVGLERQRRRHRLRPVPRRPLGRARARRRPGSSPASPATRTTRSRSTPTTQPATARRRRRSWSRRPRARTRRRRPLRPVSLPRT